MLQRSAIILAGGSSTRIQQDKGLLSLGSKPLVSHVIEAVGSLADETIVVVSSESQKQTYEHEVGDQAEVIIDVEKIQSPLVGALTGFHAAQSEYSLLLPCDSPFASKDVLSLLFELCQGKSAAIPRWPNCFIEPLHAVYCTLAAREAAERALAKGQLKMQAIVDYLHGIRYISTLVLQQMDPNLNTFFNVNNPLDLKKAEAIFRQR